MIIYKPTTVEENYSNIINLQNIFQTFINGCIWDYNTIIWKYSDINRYNLLVSQGLVNPFFNNPEWELAQLAYRIYGFTSCAYETLTYALDCWRIHTDSKQRKRNISDKQYIQDLSFLCDNRHISKSDKWILLGFRDQRNYSTHYGRIVFCKYIFDNSVVLYNLIQVVAKLIGQLNMDSNSVSDFNSAQMDCIEEMKLALNKFKLDNNLAA